MCWTRANEFKCLTCRRLYQAHDAEHTEQRVICAAWSCANDGGHFGVRLSLLDSASGRCRKVRPTRSCLVGISRCSPLPDSITHPLTSLTHRQCWRSAILGVFASAQHRITTVEDIAELRTDDWRKIMNEAEVELPTSAKNAILRALKNVDDLQGYVYSPQLGRCVCPLFFTNLT